MEKLRGELREKNNKKKKVVGTLKDVVNVDTGKSVSCKQTYRFAKKWVNEILLRLDDIDRRLTVLEAQMKEVNKILLITRERERMNNFIEDLPDITRKIMKTLTRSRKSIRTTGKYKGRGKKKKKDVY